MRAYELARELGITSKELLAKAKDLGIPISNQLQGVADEQVARLRGALSVKPGKAAPAPVVEKPAAPPKRPPRKPPEKGKLEEKPGRPEAAPVETEKEKAAKRKPGRKAKTAQKPEGEQTEGRTRRRRHRTIGRVGAKPEAGAKVETPTKTTVPTVTRRLRPRARVRRSVSAPRKKPVSITFPVTVKEFSNKAGVKANLIIAKLMQQGVAKTMNTMLDEEEALQLAREFGVEVDARQGTDLEEELLAVTEGEGRPEALKPRAPVVTLMGHVDHGKTSLLDCIRQSNITESEHGGITQHMGAYRVRSDARAIVFLDTPGHEAFTAMRARGAQATDVVVLVVAADDGVMPQTEEAISHARAAGVPIVVAINKVDRADANVARVKQQLGSLGLMPEEWGGETIMVETSAITGQGVDGLLEMLALESELLELKANPDKKARGVVLEAKLTPGRGSVATLLVQEGTLRVGDVLLAGESYGRVRSLTDELGNELEEAPPSTPVEVTGLTGVPDAGDQAYVVDDIQKAKDIAEERERRRRLAVTPTRRHITLQDLRAQVEAGKRKELAIVLKADVQGSVEVVRDQLSRLPADEVRVEILHGAVGDISEGDVLLADASDAVIIGFNVGMGPEVSSEARQRGVEVRTYSVIYELTDHVRRALSGMLEPERREISLGEAEVRQVFSVSRLGSIAGCMVTRGVIRRNARFRLRRGDEVLYEGTLDSLRRFTNDVSEVAEGYECGMRLAGFNDIQEGDRIEAYTIEEVARTL